MSAFGIISNSENSEVEFKRDDLKPKDLAKELVAFSNFDGGRVLIGVDDDGSISGLQHDPQETEEGVMSIARDKVRPSLIPHFQVLRNVAPGTHVAIVRVDVGYTVVARYHNNNEEYFIRAGSQSVPMRQDELQRAFQQRSGLRPEMRPVPGTSLDTLDRRRLRDYFGRIRGHDLPHDDTPDSDAEWMRLLVNTEIMTAETDPPVCTLAGVLLFGRAPTQFLPQAGIHATAYPGTEKTYETIEAEDLRGPMVGLFSSPNGRPALVESGLVEQALAFVRRVSFGK